MKLQSKTKIIFGKKLGSDHAILRGDNIAINEKVIKVASKSEKDKDGDPNPNTLIVNMTFHLEKPDKHGNLTEILPINIPGEILFGMTDNYLYKHDHNTQLDVVGKRHKVGFDPKYHKDEVQKHGPSHYEESYYNQKFHHSEQALYMYLSERSNLDYVASQLKNNGVLDGTKITKITIDMHSIRYVCGNCEIGGFGLMRSQYGFRDKLSKALKDQDLELKDNAQFYFAVSAEKPHANGQSMSKKDHVDVNLATLSDAFIEADADAISIPIGETDLHRRSIFVSTKLKDTGSYNTLGRKYQSAINELKVDEYALMISRGDALKEHAELNSSICSDHDDDPYSAKDLEEIADGFSALAMLDGATQQNKDAKVIASAILKERNKIDSEVQAERANIDAIKKNLLSSIKQEVVSNLSLKVLQNMKIFVDAQETRALIKLVTNKGFIDKLATLTQSETDFVMNAHKNGLSIDENFDINYALYSNGVAINKIASLYDNLSAGDIENLYNTIGLQIIYLSRAKLSDFSDRNVIRYLQNIDEDDEALDLDQLSEIYDQNIEMFRDIVCDPEGIGTENIIKAYNECEELNSDHNDSAFSDDEEQEYEDPYGRTVYEVATANYYDDNSYNIEDSGLYDEDCCF